MTDPLAADRLARLPGPTPFLVLDLDRVATAYLGFAAALPGVDVHYAMKCNPASRRSWPGCTASAAASSSPRLAELRAAGRDRRRPADVLYSNPVKPPSHVAGARAGRGVAVRRRRRAGAGKLAEHAPGAAVYVRLRTLDRRQHRAQRGQVRRRRGRPPILLRGRPPAGAAPARAGLPRRLADARPAARTPALRPAGRCCGRCSQHGIRLDLLDLGGGFPARYAEDEPPPLAEFAAAIPAGLAATCRTTPAGVEPGRALVAEAGVMVATVIGLAERPAGAGCTSTSARSTGSWRPGDRQPAALPGDRLAAAPALRTPAHLTGPTCDSQDTILFDVLLSADLAVDDRIFIGTAGAYTTSYACASTASPCRLLHVAERVPVRLSGERQT